MYASSTHFHFALGLLFAATLKKFEAGSFVSYVLAFVFSGMLVWSAYSINAVADVDTDKLNSNSGKDKAFKRNPLLNGMLSRKIVWIFAICLSGIGLVGLLFLNQSVAILGLFALLLSWSYSLPPLRFKSIAGVDIIVISLLDTILFTMGYLVIAGGMNELDVTFWSVAAMHYTFTFGLTLPTMTADISADSAAGIRTTAVVLGAKSTNFATLIIIMVALVWSVSTVTMTGLSIESLIPAFFAVSLMLGVWEFIQFWFHHKRFGIKKPSYTQIGITCHAVAIACVVIAGVL